jgi:hypothetical protein
MVKLQNQILVSIIAAIFVAACAATPTPTPSPAVAPPGPITTVAVPTSSPPTVAPPTEPAGTDTPAPPTIAPSTPAASETPDGGVDEVVGTVVRFSAGSTSVEVSIGEDNPAVRDFLSMLPLTLTLEEFAGREKIAYLPRELAHAGSPGSDPEDGDLIYYIPWGNIGFYYNTAGIGYSDQTIHLGTYDASLDQLEQLEGQDVTVEVVR